MVPNYKAVALKYEEESSQVPTVVAKGRGHLAERILKKAKDFGVPIFQNEVLTDSLLNVDIDEQIPPALYRAVVEVFVWLVTNERNSKAS